MRRLQLSNANAFALVDDADYSAVEPYTWYLKEGYAFAKVKGKTTRLHQLLMGPPPRVGLVCDHRNRVRLDCTRDNLHFVTLSENAANSAHRKRKPTSLRGTRIVPNSSLARYEARVGKNGEIRHGPFKSLIIAALVRDLTAIDQYGTSAVLNFPPLKLFVDQIERDRV